MGQMCANNKKLRAATGQFPMALLHEWFERRG
jgi:hypothetical protein